MNRNDYQDALRDERLPPQILAVDHALMELNLVLAGNAPTPFDETAIWPTEGDISIPEQLQAIEDYFDSLSTDADMKEALNTLLDGAPSIKSAVDAVITVVEDLLQGLTGLTEGLDMGERLNAFRYLDNNHTGAMFPATDGNYGGDFDLSTEAGDTGYGFFPAIENLVAAAGGPEYDTSDVLAPLETIQAVLAAAGAIAIFGAFAAGTVSFLTNSLVVE